MLLVVLGLKRIPDVDWVLGDDGVFGATLYVGKERFQFHVHDTDRVVAADLIGGNGSVPAPTMKVERCQRYRLHVVNRMISEYTALYFHVCLYCWNSPNLGTACGPTSS